jgi:hypothetical protein
MSWALSACDVAAGQMPQVVTITLEPQALSTATLQLPAETLTPSPEPSETATPTPLPSRTPEPPTPTETPLPTLELPTLPARVPARVTWTGLPTYPGDSEPGRLFSIVYDPEIWAQTEDNFENIVLAHREIPSCILSSFTGRGLPMTWKVETDFRQIGDLFIEVSTVTSEEKVEFITFFISDKRIKTAFRLEFGEQLEACALAAEEILLSLRSFVAQPTITPTP